MCVHVPLFMLRGRGSPPGPPQGGSRAPAAAGGRARTQGQLSTAARGKPHAGDRPVAGGGSPRAEHQEQDTQKALEPLQGLV